MTLCAQKLKMRFAHKSDAAAAWAKLKFMSKLIAIYLYLYLETTVANWNKVHEEIITQTNY
jgi:hypothetical protein